MLIEGQSSISITRILNNLKNNDSLIYIDLGFKSEKKREADCVSLFCLTNKKFINLNWCTSKKIDRGNFLNCKFRKKKAIGKLNK